MSKLTATIMTVVMVSMILSLMDGIMYLSYEPSVIFGTRVYTPKFKVDGCLAQINRARTSWEKDEAVPYHIENYENGYYQISRIDFTLVYISLGDNIETAKFKSSTTEEAKWVDKHYLPLDCDKAVALGKVRYEQFIGKSSGNEKGN